MFYLFFSSSPFIIGRWYFNFFPCCLLLDCKSFISWRSRGCWFLLCNNRWGLLHNRHSECQSDSSFLKKCKCGVTSYIDCIWFRLYCCDLRGTHLSLQWLSEHPKFISNRVYLGSDSYAGLIIPMLATDIISGMHAHSPHIIFTLIYRINDHG